MMSPAEGLTLGEIARQAHATLEGDPDARVWRVASIESAGTGDIVFFNNLKYLKVLEKSKATAIILSPEMVKYFAGNRLVVENPYACYAKVASLLHPPKFSFSGIHPSVMSDSPLPADARIAAKVVIGHRVQLGENVVIHAGCVLGDDVKIGDNTILYPNVVIYHGCKVGKRAILHSGAVIGADGFGFAPEGKNWLKIPQLGTVILGDDVEVGANSTIDRGTLEDTAVGDGCKIDNLVHIGHNCKIGARCVLSGCTGVAGSVTMGEHCIIGGAGMISGHLLLCSDVTISGGSLVMKNITRPGRYTSVFPIEPHEDWLQNALHIRRLSRLSARVAELEKQIEEKKKD